MILTNEDNTGLFFQFTEADIDNFGLQDCEKEEVNDDEQQNNQARKPILDGSR